MLLRKSASFILVLFVVVCGSCNSSKGMIVPKAKINKTTAEMGTPIEISYSFLTKSNFAPLSKDMIVFVHFMDKEKKRRFQDDHTPPERMNTWKPNSKYFWNRTVFIPKNIPTGKYSVVVGVYSPANGERIELEAKRFTGRAYEIAELDIQKPPNEPAIQYTEGWYAPETDPNDIRTSWRWTKQDAIVKAHNPQENSILYLKIGGVPQTLNYAPKLSVSVDGRELEAFLVQGDQPIVRKYPLKKQDLGSNKEIEIKLAADKTFTPAADGVSRDTRILGVRVFQVYLGKAGDLTQP